MTNLKNELEKRNVLRMSNEESNRLTKECLQTALIYLMNEKPFEKITITELVQRSGVSRSAFYRNYSSKEDLILELTDNVMQDITSSLKTIRDENDLSPWFFNAFSNIRKNSKFFHLLLQANLPKETMFHNLFSLEAVFPSHSSLEHYKTLALEGAFMNIMLGWFYDGMKEDDQFMADLCAGLMKDF